MDTMIHLVAGGTGGTMGAIITCPLEVVKTRLQSSNSGFTPTPRTSISESSVSSKKPSSASGTTTRMVLTPDLATLDRRGPMQITVPVANIHSRASMSSTLISQRHCVSSRNCATMPRQPAPNMGVFQCLKMIFMNEGIAGLFKGLGPNVMGVFPSRAIYFGAYSTAKSNLNASIPKANRDSPFVHVTSAATAGFCASTATNPIWMIKTRLQLDRARDKTLNIKNCFQNIYKEHGVRGLWKGVTASYWGISETMIHFVIYEYLKKELAIMQNKKKNDDKTTFDFVCFMLCGACSKTCATIVAYPHEVARTRLREEGSIYRTFWQTLHTVYQNEGRRGLYRGLATQLIRQIPNTAIMMSTYELTVYILTKWLKEPKKHNISHNPSTT